MSNHLINKLIDLLLLRRWRGSPYTASAQRCHDIQYDIINLIDDLK